MQRTITSTFLIFSRAGRPAKGWFSFFERGERKTRASCLHGQLLFLIPLGTTSNTPQRSINLSRPEQQRQGTVRFLRLSFHSQRLLRITRGIIKRDCLVLLSSAVRLLSFYFLVFRLYRSVIRYHFVYVAFAAYVFVLKVYLARERRFGDL